MLISNAGDATGHELRHPVCNFFDVFDCYKVNKSLQAEIAQV